MTQRISVMYAGSIVESASTAGLFAEPQHPYTVGLLRSIHGSAARGPCGRSRARHRTWIARPSGAHSRHGARGAWMRAGASRRRSSATSIPRTGSRVTTRWRRTRSRPGARFATGSCRRRRRRPSGTEPRERSGAAPSAGRSPRALRGDEGRRVTPDRRARAGRRRRVARHHQWRDAGPRRGVR